MTEPGAFVRMYAVVVANTVTSLRNSMRTSAEVEFCVSAYLRSLFFADLLFGAPCTKA